MSQRQHGQSTWTRRAWISRTVQQAAALAILPTVPQGRRAGRGARAVPVDPGTRQRLVSHVQLLGDEAEALVARAVEAAQRAGAQYADARLTRTVINAYKFDGYGVVDIESVGIGVRALVNGYWGFAARPSAPLADVAQLAQNAVRQAQTNARGTPRTVALGTIPVARGEWTTPVRIDPFTVSMEEKHACMQYWDQEAKKIGLAIDPWRSYLMFARQECVVATSEGAQFRQTRIESGGEILIQANLKQTNRSPLTPSLPGTVPIPGLERVGRGWELFLDANIPEQIAKVKAEIPALVAQNKQTRPGTVGRYTLVCDGATMAALLERTLGVATQLDRALGYEANAGGTSFIADPLAMVGSLQVASPLVTITANRSAPTQLATVKWDAEGVAPREATLVKNGVLTDFQTTREQAAWLAPYYTRAGLPVQSNGYSAAETAIEIPMQQMPNLALAPGRADVQVADLIANVQDGVFLEGGMAFPVDFQGGSGMLSGSMRQIKKGKLGAMLTGVTVLFDTRDFWKHVVAVGGAQTQAVYPSSQWPFGGQVAASWRMNPRMPPWKGQPPQTTSHTTQGVAATIEHVPLINPVQKV